MTDMENINDFIDEFVRLEYCQNCGEYEYKPFHLFHEDLHGMKKVCVFPPEQNITPFFALFANFMREGSKKIYMAIDCPPFEEIETNFILIMRCENDEATSFIIPFDSKTGIKSTALKKTKLADKFLRKLEDLYNRMVVLPEVNLN